RWREGRSRLRCHDACQFPSAERGASESAVGLQEWQLENCAQSKVTGRLAGDGALGANVIRVLYGRGLRSAVLVVQSFGPGVNGQERQPAPVPRLDFGLKGVVN